VQPYESVENARNRKAFGDKYGDVLGRLTAAERTAVTKVGGMGDP
jgi:hypothetical protein